jgi:glycerol-3-phosphate dehydrogenase
VKRSFDVAQDRPFPIEGGLEFSPQTRHISIERLMHEQFDVIVVGGGITGCGIARDAALRGFKTALVEKGDFASGTSSKSSKLIHGGLRYLQNFEFGLVFEASAERRVLRRLAPHLVKPLPFVMPVYRYSSPGYLQLRAGMWLYDMLALFRNIKMHRMLSPREVARLEPEIDQDQLVGAARFYDCGVDDARLTLATIRSAHRYGAAAANYVRLIGLLKANGRVCGIAFRNGLTGEEGEAKARLVLNATGPWSYEVMRMDNPATEQQVRPTKGIHILVPRGKIGNRNALAFVAARDKRLMFVIPWGRYSIIGTTDTDYIGDADRPYADVDDIDYVLDSFNKAFPKLKLTEGDIASTYAGLRPLAIENVASSYKVSREHRILESESGLLSIIGGKLTTYRVMAKQLVDAAEKRLAKEFGVQAVRGCETGKYPLEGGLPGLHVRVVQEATTKGQSYGLGPETVEHLVTSYGTDYGGVMALIEKDRPLAEPIVPGLSYLKAEINYAVQHEMAMTLSDFLGRRTHVLLEALNQGLDQAQAVAEAMGKLLRWSMEETQRQVANYRDEVALSRMWGRGY